MPSILKRFINPEAKPYEFPAAEGILSDASTPSFAELFEEAEWGSREEAVKDPTPQSPVDYALLQAEAILEDARRQAQELLEQAKLEMENELTQLKGDAQDEGFRTGYAAGMSHAIKEAQSQRTSQAVELGSEVRRFLEKATLAQDALLQQTQDELRDLAIAVAEKIVRVSLKSSGDIIARMIQGATEKLKRKEWVHIYIAGCDAKAMAQVTPYLTSSLSFLSDHVKIIPMADDESGTCIIEMPDEIIDASAATQLSNIRDMLSEG